MKHDPTPERANLTLGVMPLVDAAPLIVAQAGGFFAREGLAVELSRERAWASVRDKLAAGLLDGAQLLAPMPLAATAGLDPQPRPMIAAAALNQGGSAVCVSTALHTRLRAQLQGEPGPLQWAQALRRVVEAERGSRSPLTLAHVFPYSSHHYELRWWLASAGLHPDRDLNLVVVPPPLMLEQLESGRIDGYCVGSPWPELAQARGSGHLLFDKRALWRSGPDKVFGLAQDWADAHPATVQSLLRALIRAAQWLDDDTHHAQAAQWMVEGEYLDAPAALVTAALSQMRFHDDDAGFPWRSQALWLLAQMQRWQHLPADGDLAAIARTAYRPDLYREAAQALGLTPPLHDQKIEGARDDDGFFDGTCFDPATRLSPR